VIWNETCGNQRRGVIALSLTDQRMAAYCQKLAAFSLLSTCPPSHGPRAGGRASLDWALKPTRCKDGALCSSAALSGRAGNCWVAARHRVLSPALAGDQRPEGGGIPPGRARDRPDGGLQGRLIARTTSSCHSGPPDDWQLLLTPAVRLEKPGAGWR
jgi:hypothetical protein